MSGTVFALDRIGVCRTEGRRSLCLCILAGVLAAIPVRAEIVGTTRVAAIVGGGQTVFATHAPQRPEDLFIVSRRGVIYRLDLATGTVSATLFLDISARVDDAGGEQGLLGLAFHPDYATNGFFFVNYTRDPGPGLDRTRVERFQAVNPLTATSVSAATATPVLEFEQSFANHNGGWIGFGPLDGYLYISSGDGGSGNDPNDSGQSLDTRLGKILRVDVDGDDFPSDAIENWAVPAGNPFASDGDPDTFAAIWAYGLRNPWRASFDRITGDLWIGDVGQGAREEIDFQPAGSTVAANYGWRLREGDVQTPGVGGPAPPDHVPPVYDYLSNGAGAFGGNSVVGGYVFRGPDSEVDGRYFFGDSFPSQLWTFDPADPAGTVQNVDSILNPSDSIGTPVAFGEDHDGRLYIVDLDGEIYRIDTDGVAIPASSVFSLAALGVSLAWAAARRLRRPSRVDFDSIA